MTAKLDSFQSSAVLSKTLLNCTTSCTNRILLYEIDPTACVVKPNVKSLDCDPGTGLTNYLNTLSKGMYITGIACGTNDTKFNDTMTNLGMNTTDLKTDEFLIFTFEQGKSERTASKRVPICNMINKAFPDHTGFGNVTVNLTSTNDQISYEIRLEALSYAGENKVVQVTGIIPSDCQNTVYINQITPNSLQITPSTSNKYTNSATLKQYLSNQLPNYFAGIACPVNDSNFAQAMQPLGLQATNTPPGEFLIFGLILTHQIIVSKTVSLGDIMFQLPTTMKCCLQMYYDYLRVVLFSGYDPGPTRTDLRPTCTYTGSLEIYLYVFDLDRCTFNETSRNSIYYLYSDSTDLNNYIQSMENGSWIVGIACVNEPNDELNSTLISLGVNVGELQPVSVIGFILNIGYPTIYEVLAVQNVGNNNTVTATISGLNVCDLRDIKGSP